MRYLGLSLAIALQFSIPFAATVSAQTTVDSSQVSQSTPGVESQQPQTGSTQTTIDGLQVGEHVSSMAPEHPLLHGVLFGECVSELAITGECPHDHE